MHDFNCFSQSILNGIKLCKELKDSKTLEQNINTALQYTQDSIKHFESIDNLNTFKSMPQNISIGNYQLTKKSIHIRSTKNIDGTNKRRLSNQQLIPTYEFTDKDGKIHEIREDKNKTWRRLSVIDLGAKTSIRKCKSRRIWNINKNYI